jgi:hypothetical protein
MKTLSQFHRLGFGLAIIMACGLLTASVQDKTALELAKEGNKYVIEQSQDKVVQIRSEKSTGGTTPNTWYITYFEGINTPKGTELKLATGTELKFVGSYLQTVKRNVRLLDSESDSYAELDPQKLLVDSESALSIALKQPILDNLHVLATDMRLEQNPEGSPVWKVSIWAAKKGTKVDVKVGEIWLSSVDGKVCKINVDPARAS